MMILNTTRYTVQGESATADPDETVLLETTERIWETEQTADTPNSNACYHGPIIFTGRCVLLYCK
jgi:hypothetical protein